MSNENELKRVDDDLSTNLIAMAIEKGADVDSLSKLMDLQERQMDKKAEQDYNRAITGFQSELRPIGKNKTSYVGSYATLDHIAKSIAPILAEHELSYSFDSEITDGIVLVVCHINHINGHARSAKFSAPIDAAAKVNDMQKTASALSYARRYALQLALGITTTDEDDDGETGGIQTAAKKEIQQGTNQWKNAIIYYKENGHFDAVRAKVDVSSESERLIIQQAGQ